MKVKLNTSLSNGPLYGTIGEAICFRYDETDTLILRVLFYGWPGVYSVDPSDVETMLSV